MPAQAARQTHADVESASRPLQGNLERILRLADAQPEWCLLEVSAGEDRAALQFAPYVRRVVALSSSWESLRAARTVATEPGVSSIVFTVGDAESLPFAAGTFDGVVSRFAAHHFSDSFRFVQECARVLKPGGRLLIEDHLAPDDQRAARYIDSFYRLRDPRHVRSFAGYEWEGMLLDAGLSVAHIETFTGARAKLVPWAQGCPLAVLERLHVMLAQTPVAVTTAMNPVCAGTPDAAFDQPCIIIVGHQS